MKMNVESVIRKLFLDVLESTGGSLESELTPSAVLLETGLDSLGFAILVTRLEQELGYDPFTMMTDVVYPRTYGEFVDIYEKFSPVSE